ncbi:MAG TPA: hypothetical protein VGK66_02410, partial [Solirubrobacterales bacterium]
MRSRSAPNRARSRSAAKRFGSQITETAPSPASSPEDGALGSAGKHLGSGLMTQDIDQLAINTIRTLSMDAVQKANSGHPGMPMAMAPLAYLLFREVMNHDPRDPQ